MNKLTMKVETGRLHRLTMPWHLCRAYLAGSAGHFRQLRRARIRIAVKTTTRLEFKPLMLEEM